MPKNLIETNEYTAKIEVPTDGEAYNENVQDKALGGINNRVVNNRSRIQLIEDNVGPELLFTLNGSVIATEAIGVNKLGLSLPGRPIYSNPQQYWGPVDASTFAQNGANWPDSNSQYPFTGTGSPLPGPIATPGEWMILNNRAEEIEDITPAQAKAPVHIYAPVSGWYRVTMNVNIFYYLYQPSPGGNFGQSTSVSVLMKTFKNDIQTSYAGSYVKAFLDNNEGIDRAGSEADKLDLYNNATLTNECMVYLAGNSTNLEDYFFPDFFVTPGYDDIYLPLTNPGRLPQLTCSFKMTRVVGPKLTP